MRVSNCGPRRLIQTAQGTPGLFPPSTRVRKRKARARARVNNILTLARELNYYVGYDYGERASGEHKTIGKDDPFIAGSGLHHHPSAFYWPPARRLAAQVLLRSRKPTQFRPQAWGRPIATGRSSNTKAAGGFAAALSIGCLGILADDPRAAVVDRSATPPLPTTPGRAEGSQEGGCGGVVKVRGRR